MRTAAASSVYRLFAVRRTCRRVPTGAGAIALAGVDMALRVRKGDVWDFVAVVGICVSHALRVGRGEKLESSLLSYKHMRLYGAQESWTHKTEKANISATKRKKPIADSIVAQ